MSQPQPVELSLEQKFSIRSFETQVGKMSHDQAKEFLVKMYEEMIVKDMMYQHFLKKEWGLDTEVKTSSGDDIIEK